MTTLSDLHTRYDGPIPAAELANVVNVPAADHVAHEIAAYRGFCREEVRKLRSIKRTLADPTMAIAEAAEWTEARDMVRGYLSETRKRHGALCARLRKMTGPEPVAMRKAA